ncbi:organic cation/carnitine transporter 7 [Lolium perenne]|uniref:organic cation/carnitine transporter 7 n=1 Tax=Lolium perenne TaxID=4522 RepID=UPI0021F51FA3|nr:organic cation/carnitine transporter 7-like [Lolium perenne]
MAGDEAVAGGAECCYYTTDDALSHVGFGRFQALVLAYAGVGWTAEAMEIMLLSFVGPSVKDEWGISAQQEGLITSVVFAGMIIGACLGGVISDSYGRRAGFLFTAVVTGIFGFLSALSPNYICLLTLRFVVGMGLGAGHVLGTWFFEFVPAAKRGTWVVVFHCTWTFGTIFQALIAWAIMPVLGWRWLIALSSSPCFVLLIFYGVTPESPRYLCSRGRTADAKLILERIARVNNMSLPSGILIQQKVSDNGVDVETILPLITSQDSDATDMSISTKSSFTNAFRTLVSRSLIRSTLLLWFVYFAFSFAYSGIVLLTSELSNGERRCAPVGMPLRQQNDVRLYRDVLVTSIAEFPGLILAALLVDRFGRKLSMEGFILLCFAFIAPLAVPLGEGLATTLLFSARACIMGSYAVLYIYGPEIYPTSCRNTGVGVATSVGRIGGMVAPLIAVGLLENCHQKEAVFIFDVVLFLAAVACALFPLETKGCQIQ